MSSKPKSSQRYLPPKDHLAAIGAIATVWTAIEYIMETTILGLYEIDLGRGLVIANDLSFHSRLSILHILAGDGEKGPIGNAALADELKAILARLDSGYGDRNIIVHGLWGPTDKLGVIRRLTIRTRGKRLKTISEDYSANQIWEVEARLGDLCRDFSALAGRMGIDTRLATAPVHSRSPLYPNKTAK